METKKPDPRRQRILIVDDDPLITQALSRILADKDREVLTVGQRHLAASEIQDKPFALVFLDLHLKDGTCVDLLREIREESPSTCVVVMSADSPDGGEEAAIEDFAHHFLPKPFEALQVRTLVRQILAGT